MLGQVAGIGQQQPDLPAAVIVAGAVTGGGVVRGDAGGGVFGGADHGLEPGDVDGVGGQAGGDDQAVGAGDVLGVVALDEPVAAGGHQPGVRVGGVADRAGARARGGPGGGLALGPGLAGEGPGQARGGAPDQDMLGGRQHRVAAQALARRGDRRGVAGVPVLEPGLLRRGDLVQAQLRGGDVGGGRAAALAGMPRCDPVQVGAGLRVPLLLGGFPLGAQAGQRRGDPVVPAARVGQPGGDLVAADARPEQGVLGRVGGGVLGGELRGQLPQPVLGPVR